MSYVDNSVDFGDFFLKKVEGKKNREGNIKFLFCTSFLSDIAKYRLGQIIRAKYFTIKFMVNLDYLFRNSYMSV